MVGGSTGDHETDSTDSSPGSDGIDTGSIAGLTLGPRQPAAYGVDGACSVAGPITP